MLFAWTVASCHMCGASHCTCTPNLCSDTSAQIRHLCRCLLASHAPAPKVSVRIDDTKHLCAVAGGRAGHAHVVGGAAAARGGAVQPQPGAHDGPLGVDEGRAAGGGVLRQGAAQFLGFAFVVRCFCMLRIDSGSRSSCSLIPIFWFRGWLCARLLVLWRVVLGWHRFGWRLFVYMCL